MPVVVARKLDLRLLAGLSNAGCSLAALGLCRSCAGVNSLGFVVPTGRGISILICARLPWLQAVRCIVAEVGTIVATYYTEKPGFA
jgi:hypothetical protein